MGSQVLLAVPDGPELARHGDYLGGRGYDVAACGDGLACAARLREGRPDVLVLDADLPWGAGDGVLALMREGDLPAVPVVLLTAGLASHRANPFGRYPVRASLSKPVPPERLEHAVRRAAAEPAPWPDVVT